MNRRRLSREMPNRPGAMRSGCIRRLTVGGLDAFQKIVFLRNVNVRLLCNFFSVPLLSNY